VSRHDRSLALMCLPHPAISNTISSVGVARKPSDLVVYVLRAMQAFYAILNGTTDVVPTDGNQVRVLRSGCPARALLRTLLLLECYNCRGHNVAAAVCVQPSVLIAHTL
jgi:hypothetical protein